MVTSVWLVGLMGSGKSTVGRLVAETLGLAYVDNDDAVATLAGATVVDLAEHEGEGLHEWESSYVRSLPNRGPCVAGVPASTADRVDELDLLRASGLLVYLRCDVATLVARVTAGPPRPWLAKDTEATVRAMYDARDPRLVPHVDLVVDGTQPPYDVVRQVLDHVG